MGKLTLLLLFLSVNSVAKAENTHLGCDDYGLETSLNFTGEVLLSKKFLGDPNDPLLKEAITHQLRYLRGYFINRKKDLGYSLTVNAKTPSIEIIIRKNTPYGSDLQIDKIDSPQVHVTEPYILKAMDAKSVRKSDPAQLITYRLSAPAYFCGPPTKIQEIEIQIPKDPYLIYWSVSPKDRSLIKWRKSQFRINPCGDSELADLPDPFYYWYFWNPLMAGQDAEGKSFNCEKLLPSKDIYKTRVGFSSKKTVTQPPPVLNHILPDTVNVSTAFGIIDEKFKILNWQAFLVQLQGETSPTLARIQYGLKKMRAAHLDPEWDRGSQYLMSFFAQLDQLMTVQETIIDLPKKQILLKGALTKSSKKIHLKVYFGPTDVLGMTAPAHWEFLAEALRTADFILYNGHSGLGENFQISNIAKAIKQAPEKFLKGSPKYQFIGYFSCYSYGYFGDDIVSERQSMFPDSITDVLLTSTEFTSDRGPLGILHMIDQKSLSLKPIVDDSTWLFPSDQILIKNFKIPLPAQVKK